MTLVFGTEKGRFLKGVGTGVTATTYFNVPRNKGPAKEEIKGLQCAVEKKNAEVKALSSKVDEQAQQLQFIFAHLAATGLKLPNMPKTSGISIDTVPEPQVTSNINISQEPRHETLTPAITKTSKQHIQNKVMSASADKQSPPVKSATVKNTKRVVAPKPSKTILDFPAISPNTPIPQPIKCTLSYPDKRNIIARGELHLSAQRQSIHGVPLQDDCYKVSILEMVKKDSFLPYVTGGMKTVEEAYKSFVPWPKFLVKVDAKEPTVKPGNHKLPVVQPSVKPSEEKVQVEKSVLKSVVKEPAKPQEKLLAKSVGNEDGKSGVKTAEENVPSTSLKHKVYISSGNLAKRTRTRSLNFKE